MTLTVSLIAGLILSAVPAGVGTPTIYCHTNLDTAQTMCVTDRHQQTRVQASIGVGDTPTTARAALTAAARYKVVTLYTNDNFGGSQWSFWQSAPCTGPDGRGWEIANLWDLSDKVTSFRGFSGCRITLYEHADFGGKSYGPASSSANVGEAFNDLASSVRGSA